MGGACTHVNAHDVIVRPLTWHPYIAGTERYADADSGGGDVLAV